jgi:hypothetical protein
MQGNFSGGYVNQSEYFRADGAEPIVNDIMKVVGSIRENGHINFGQVEAKELAAHVIIEAGAARRVGTLRNHPALFPPKSQGRQLSPHVGSWPFLRLPAL